MIPMPFGVAVIGETVQATRTADARSRSTGTSPVRRRRLRLGAGQGGYARHGKDPNTKALEWFSKGDASKALADAPKQLTAEYFRSIATTRRWSP